MLHCYLGIYVKKNLLIILTGVTYKIYVCGAICVLVLVLFDIYYL